MWKGACLYFQDLEGLGSLPETQLSSGLISSSYCISIQPAKPPLKPRWLPHSICTFLLMNIGLRTPHALFTKVCLLWLQWFKAVCYRHSSEWFAINRRNKNKPICMEQQSQSLGAVLPWLTLPNLAAKDASTCLIDTSSWLPSFLPSPPQSRVKRHSKGLCSSSSCFLGQDPTCWHSIPHGI